MNVRWMAQNKNTNYSTGIHSSELLDNNIDRQFISFYNWYNIISVIIPVQHQQQSTIIN